MDVLTPSEVGQLQPWIDAEVFGPAEVHATAAVASQLVGDAGSLWPDERVLLGYALAVWAPLHGHACVDLESVATDVAAELAIKPYENGNPYEDGTPGEDGAGTARPVAALPWPDPRSWGRALRQSPAVRVVNTVDTSPHLDDRPLVLAGSRLYTQRQWVDECVVGTTLRRLAGAPLLDAPAASADLLARLLPPSPGDENSQLAAATTALSSRLSVIVGGPGTGKTHTVACLLAALVASGVDGPGPGRSAGPPGLRIGIAAPTGKAAARITESIAAVARTTLGEHAVRPDVAAQLAGLSAVTIHRLLGPRAEHRTRFRHDGRTPLPFDVVVIDETSMLPLPLMARLLEAVADTCRLVLVGDPDQLESIEVGAVLGDIVRAAEPAGASLHRNVVRLTGQHRTGISSPIAPLADAIRAGDSGRVLAELQRGASSLLSFVEVDDLDSRAAHDAVRAAVGEQFVAARDAARRGESVAALDAMSSARVLCAHRNGPAGVWTWNRHIESWLLDTPARHHGYPGRAVLATRNDPRTGIVNGDAGVLIRAARVDGGEGPLRAVFRRGEAIRDFAPAELDDLETAFAVTVHKSQGSEYDTVVVIHPPADSPLIGRELLYTAVTRASRRLVVVGSAESIRRAVESPTRRVTGLTDALR